MDWPAHATCQFVKEVNRQGFNIFNPPRLFAHLVVKRVDFLGVDFHDLSRDRLGPNIRRRPAHACEASALSVSGTDPQSRAIVVKVVELGF